MLEIEHILVKAYGWSLYEIDRTDVESLLPFLFYNPDTAERVKSKDKRVFCDQVSWL